MITAPVRLAAQAQADLPPDRPFRRNSALEIRRIGACLRLVNPDIGAERHLDPMEAGIWYLLKDPTTLNEAVAVLRQTVPDRDPESIRARVAGLFRALLAANMILPESRKVV